MAIASLDDKRLPDDLRERIENIAKTFLNIVDEASIRKYGKNPTEEQDMEIYHSATLAWHEALAKVIMKSGD